MDEIRLPPSSLASFARCFDGIHCELGNDGACGMNDNVD
jgi:hypothetical protein